MSTPLVSVAHPSLTPVGPRRANHTPNVSAGKDGCCASVCTCVQSLCAVIIEAVFHALSFVSFACLPSVEKKKKKRSDVKAAAGSASVNTFSSPSAILEFRFSFDRKEFTDILQSCGFWSVLLFCLLLTEPLLGSLTEQ